MSLDALLSIAHDEDFKNITFCKQLIQRAFQERNTVAIKSLLEKMSATFVFADKEFRRQIIEYLYRWTRSLAVDVVLDLGRDSILGNVCVLFYFITQIGPVTSEKIETFAKLSKLKYIKDPLALELIPTNAAIILNLDEKVNAINKPREIEESIEICELLFMNGLLARTNDTITGMLMLYQNSSQAKHKFKAQIVFSLLEKKLDVFLSLIKKIIKDVDDEDGLIAHYVEIYDLLVRTGLPVFFDFNKVSLELDSLFNGNFYFAKVLYESGDVGLLMPFEDIAVNHIQKVYDLETADFVTPRKRIGRILFHDVFSFRRVQQVADVTEEQVDLVKSLYEIEIEKKIREILQDQNITSHSPAEKIDVYTLKLHINNEKDLRDVGMILKGRGYPTINLDSIASNILKAVDLPVHIVFLVHTGILLDEAREKFVKQCRRARKMYCVIDSVDLTRLLCAYNKLSYAQTSCSQ